MRFALNDRNGSLFVEAFCVSIIALLFDWWERFCCLEYLGKGIFSEIPNSR
jgi:hypothetical protein